MEKDWETALANQQKLREKYARLTHTSPRILSAAERQTITVLASDINGLWHATTTTIMDRKEIARAIVVAVIGASQRVETTMVWTGGAATSGELIRPVQHLDQLSRYPQLIGRIRELAGQGLGANGTADRLHAEGYRPARGGKQITATTIRDLMRRLGCPTGRIHCHRPTPPGEEPGPDE